MASLHTQLMEHGWNFNQVSQMYSNEFLIFPDELPVAEAYQAHISLIEYFSSEEGEVLLS